jgi:hypothetical protein
MAVCVHGLYDLAAWLLAGTKDRGGGNFDLAAIKDAVKEEDKRTIALKRPVQVVWACLDGWESPVARCISATTSTGSKGNRFARIAGR